MRQLGLSIALAGLFLILTTTGLRAGGSYYLTRITTGRIDRDSQSASINSDGTRIAFRSDANLMDPVGIPRGQREIWLATSPRSCYLPMVARNGSP